MLRRISVTGGLLRLLPALLLAASLAAPNVLEAQAAGQGAASSPAAAPDSGADPPPPLTNPPPTPAPAPVPTGAPAPAAPGAPGAKSSASTAVSIVDFAFDPAAVTVHAGDTVLWTDNGTDPKGHTVTGSGFDSGILQTGAVFSFTFPAAGTFSYACSVHPEMKGTVRVLAATAGSGNSQGAGKKKSGESGSSSPNASGSATAPTASGSESAAVSSPGAAGSDSSLPSTGSDSPLLAGIGLLLLDLGLALRLVGPRR
jgi:plastocyanin